MATKQAERRKARIRRTIKAVAGARLRLSVFRSSQHIYAHVIDDRKGAPWRPRCRSERICGRASRRVPISAPPSW
jgi:Ribosomal L18 of archaea, bacteria, mitoch. and chloroplast